MSPNPALLTWPRAVLPSGGSGYEAEVLADAPPVFFMLDDAAPPPANLGSEVVAASAWATSWPTFDGDMASFPGNAAYGILTDWPFQQALPWTVEALIVWNGGADSTITAETQGTLYSRKIFRVDSAGTLRVVSSGPGWPTSSISSGTVQVGVLTHVATTVGPSGCVLYINGAAAGSGSSSSVTNDNGSLSIGVRRENEVGYRNPFNGKIGGVAVYRSELPAARILAHAQAAGVA